MALLSKQNNRGFTLIELMVTVAIMALIMALAAPSFRDILVALRVRTTAFNIISDLVLARSEAIKRGEDITLTPIANWTGGWSVTVASTAEVLSSQNSVGSGVTFTTAPSSITFDRNGRSISTSVVRVGLTDGRTRNRCISLDPSGRPKSSNTGCAT